MKAVFFLLFLYSQLSYSNEEFVLSNFLIPLTQCKEMGVGLYEQKEIEENRFTSFLLVCRSSHYFLNCYDSYNNEISFELRQFSEGKYLYKSETASLVLDLKNKSSILSQFEISKKNLFSNLMCKGLFYKNFNKVLPNIYLNDGIKTLIKKGDSDAKK